MGDFNHAGVHSRGIRVRNSVVELALLTDCSENFGARAFLPAKFKESPVCANDGPRFRRKLLSFDAFSCICYVVDRSRRCSEL